MGKKSKNKKSKASSLVATDWRAQALAARSEYHSPVDTLFTFGEVGFNEKWPDYSDLKFSEADESELARMACDPRLDFAESPVAVSAPIHAMRILAQRGNSEFLLALFATFRERDDYDLFHEEMPHILATIGASVIPYVQAYLALPEESPYDRAVLSNGLVAIARKHRSSHAQVVNILTNELSHYKENSEDWNGFIIANLVELAAGEALPLIEKVFIADAVDDMICGDLNDIRAEFGLVAPRRDDGPLFIKDANALLPNSTRRFTSNKKPEA